MFSMAMEENNLCTYKGRNSVWRLESIKKIFEDFFQKSAVHGLAYFVKSYLSILERLLWLVLVIGALFGSIFISLQSLDRYYHKSTVITLEKDHYYWNTSLPSLTICPMMYRISSIKFESYCRNHNIVGTNKLELYEFLESLANSSFLNFEDIKEFKSVENLHINPKDYMMLIYNLTEDLTRVFAEDKRVRTMNNLEYIHVQQVLTEYGICYVTNNYLSEQLSTNFILKHELPGLNIFEQQADTAVHRVRYGNLFDGDITYSFIGFEGAISIFIHSPYETMDIGRNYGYAIDAMEFDVHSVEIVASEKFGRDTTVSQRGCRFNHESNLTHFKHIYTKNLCTQECRMNFALTHCKCIPHFYPNDSDNPKPVCNYTVLKNCFPKYKNIFLTFREPNDGKQVIECNCLQNCQDSKVIVVNKEVMGESKDLVGSIGGLIIVKKYPLSRFKRQVLFTFTDLLVSIGGTAGLFLGFSVLGALEVLYFFTLRLFWHLMRRQQ